MDWSDDIVVVNLSDEPALSDELSSLREQLEHRAVPAARQFDGAGQSGESATQTGSETGSPAPGPSVEGLPHAVLDFSQVSYISSSNIAQLLQLRSILESAGRRMVLCALSDDVWSVLLVTGLDKIFRFAPDPMTALAGLQMHDA